MEIVLVQNILNSIEDTSSLSLDLGVHMKRKSLGSIQIGLAIQIGFT